MLAQGAKTCEVFWGITSLNSSLVRSVSRRSSQEGVAAVICEI